MKKNLFLSFSNYPVDKSSELRSRKRTGVCCSTPSGGSMLSAGAPVSFQGMHINIRFEIKHIFKLLQLVKDVMISCPAKGSFKNIMLAHLEIFFELSNIPLVM